MTEVVLHIGMHKTATTSIQNGLRGYDDGAIRYADFGVFRGNHSIPMSTMFLWDPFALRQYKSRGVAASEIVELRREYARKLEHQLDEIQERLLISGEGMSFFSTPEVAFLRAFLLQKVEAVKAFAFVRDPLGFASSGFQQSVKSGLPRFMVQLPNYRKRFEPYLQAFPEGAVDLVAFDPAGFPEGGIMEAFAHRIGLAQVPSTPRHANESLSALAVSFLYQWNRSDAFKLGSEARVLAHKAVVRTLQNALPGKLRLSPVIFADGERKRVIEEDLAWLQEAGGVAFPDLATGDLPGAIANEKDLLDVGSDSLKSLEDILDAEGCRRSGSDAPEMLQALFEHFLATGTNIKS